MKPSCYREMFSFIWVLVICRVRIVLFCLGNQSTASFDVYCTSMLYAHSSPVNARALRSRSAGAACSNLNAMFRGHVLLGATFWAVTKEMKTLGFVTPLNFFCLLFCCSLQDGQEGFCSVCRGKDKIIESVSRFKSLQKWNCLNWWKNDSLHNAHPSETSPISRIGIFGFCL